MKYFEECSNIRNVIKGINDRIIRDSEDLVGNKDTIIYLMQLKRQILEILVTKYPTFIIKSYNWDNECEKYRLVLQGEIIDSNNYIQRYLLDLETGEISYFSNGLSTMAIDIKNHTTQYSDFKMDRIKSVKDILIRLDYSKLEDNDELLYLRILNYIRREPTSFFIDMSEAITRI